MLSRKLKYFILDVFGEEKYSGNQLAVFTDAKNLSSEEMQFIASEINFSETTFITQADAEKAEFEVRIFTPKSEIPFAGHPTLGTAYILNKLYLSGKASELFIKVMAGTIPLQFTGDTLWMKQIQPTFEQSYSTAKLSQAIGVKTSEIENKFPAQVVSTGMPFLIVPLKSLDALKNINIITGLSVKVLNTVKANGILAFAPGSFDNENDLSVRVFVPVLGIPEDPATGSANGCLAAYLVKYKCLQSTSVDISLAQGVEMGRPSRLFIKASEEKGEYSIYVGGKVIEIAEGSWH